MKYVKLSILTNEITPPYFIGSQIRGVFGYALKKIVCINPSFKCEECFAKENCLYYEFYEEKNRFHKYRLDFELGKSYYDFDFILFDSACEKLPYIISAFYKLFNEFGLGKDRKKIQNFDIFVNGKNIKDNNSNIKIPKDYIKEFKTNSFSSKVLLKFITPLRIKKKNRFIKDDSIELKDILDSIFKRNLQLQDKEFKKFPFEIKGKITKKDLRLKKLTRFSNRQQTKMNLDGIVGEVEIDNLSKEEYNLLKLGELIGVGKQVVFGLGKIEVKDRDERK